MDFEYYEEILIKILNKTTYDKDKAFWIKVYTSAERQEKLGTLEEIIADFKYQLQVNAIDNPPAYLTAKIKKELVLDETAIVRVEGNLVEHPFYRHGRRTNEPIKFSGSHYDEKTKTKIKTDWVLTSESMVPNDEDADIFRALLQIFIEQGMPESGEILFTRYDICKRLKKPFDGHSYRDIENALKYIFESKITSKEAFLRFKEKVFLNTSGEKQYIRLIDSYVLRDSAENADGSKEMFQSRLVLGHYIVENMRLYYSTHINWDFYISLHSSISKRIYEYLQKKRGKEKKSKWKEKLLSFAERMGMSVKTPRNVKHNLKNALEELKSRDYIYDCKIAKEKTNEGKEEFINFSFTDTEGVQLKLKY